MNTYEKGLNYEENVYNSFKTILESEDFFVPSKLSIIKFKPKYYSQQRQSYITFDISIETKLKDSKDYSLLTLIECKNYGSKVPIDDLEEFVAKLDQVAPHNCKGIIITPLGFQGSCIEYARNNGIALARMGEEAKVNWDLNRISNNGKGNTVDWINNKIENTLIDENIKITEDFFGAIYRHYAYYSKIEFFKDFLNLDLKKIETIDSTKIKVKFIEEADIKIMVKAIFKAKIGRYTYHNYKNLFYEFINKIKDEVKVINDCDLGVNNRNQEIIGRFKNGQIYILGDNKMYLSRFCFTLAHEIGHFYLHSNSEWYNQFGDNLLDLDFEEINYYGMDEEGKRLEIQANIFAAELLVPDELLILKMKDVIEMLKIVDKGYGIIYLDGQETNYRLFENVVAEIKKDFPGSKAVIRLKLEALGFINKINKKNHALLKMFENIEEQDNRGV